MKRGTILVVTGLLAACGGGTSSTDVQEPGPDTGTDCEAMVVEFAEQGFRWTAACGDVDVTLRPKALVDGAWRGGGKDGPCLVDGASLACPAGEDGVVSVSLVDHVATLAFEASTDVVVQGLSLEGEGHVAGATAWLSNGFQSWSHSGVLALASPPSSQELDAALKATGTLEVVREGTELSWWYTWVGGEASALVAGVLTADRWRSYVQIHRGGDEALVVRLVSGSSGEKVALPAGGTVESEPWWIGAGTDLEDLQREYGEALPTRRSPGEAAEAGWNSWYHLWDDVDDEAVRANALLARQVLEPTLPSGASLRIVVDDGWQVRWGEWQTNAKFPKGLDGLASDLKADGFTTGVWLAPLLVDADSVLVADHPDWFVDGARYDHPEHGWMNVLDVTHPEAASHLTAVVSTIVAWGLDLLKIDFLFAGTLNGDRHEDVTPMASYRRALEIIREAAGEDVFLLAVGAPPIAGFDLLDGWRLGPDIAYEPFGPGWAFVADEARSVAARWPLCLSVFCDPDPPLLRTLPKNEVEAGAWVVAFAGGGLFLSDDLREVPEDRYTWGMDGDRVGLAMGGVPCVPEDPAPMDPPAILNNAVASHLLGSNLLEVPRVWRTPDGRRVALNMDDEEAVIGGVKIPAHTAQVLP